MESTVENASPPAPKAALWEDYIDIFYAPRQVYRRRSGGGFMITLLILTIVMTALFFASRGPLATAMEAEMMRGIANSPQASQMTAEQLEQMRSMSGIFGTIGIAFFFPVGVMLAGLVMWAVGKMFDLPATVGMCIMIMTYAQFPRVLGGMAALGQALVSEPETLNEVAISPARFVDADAASPILLGLLGRFDLFVIWSAILSAIGLQVVGKLTPARAYTVAAIVWILGAAPVLMGAFAG